MKILELRFKNLNSLYGEWHIDFTRSEYLTDGIFAITGPTGAGKSTVLDAICLALYGETPRLGKITAKNNEIISRKTADCYAEVTFSTSTGSYRCYWSQSRARKKFDGALQDAKHEIADALTGKILESKKTEVKLVIENKTGMNFERFTRSILLAQGSFAAFLQASADERSPILEQITGTEIYSNISKKVHERQKITKDKLDILTAEIGEITVLDQDQVNNLKQQQVESLTQITRLTNRQKTIQNGLQQYHNLSLLSTELIELEMAKKQVLEEINQFQPLQSQLNQAIKASELEGEFATVVTLRKQHETDQQNLIELDNQLPTITKNLMQEQQLLNNQQHVVLTVKLKQKNMLPLINQVRTLDLQQLTRNNQLEQMQVELTLLVTKITQNRLIYQASSTKLAEIIQKHNQQQRYLQQHSQDELLIEKLASIQQQLNNIQQINLDLVSVHSVIQQKKIILVEHTDELQNNQKQLNEVTKNHEEYLNIIEQHNSSLLVLLNGRLLREYRSDKDHLQQEKNLRIKINSLQEERQKLIHGNPCPLCGSHDHPFAIGNTPKIDEIDQQLQALNALIFQAENIETAIKQTQENVQLFAAKKDKLTNTLNIITIKINSIEQSLKEAEVQQQELNFRHTKLSNEFVTELNLVGILELPDNSEMIKLIDQLTQRRDKWLQYQQSNNYCNEQRSLIDAELRQLDSIKQLLDSQLIAKQKESDSLKQQIADNQEQRINIFGNKSPDEEEQALANSINDAENELQRRQKSCEKIKETHSQIKTKQQTILHNIEQAREILTQKEHHFTKQLQAKEFINEEAFFISRLPENQRTSLAEQATLLINKQTTIMASIHDRQKRQMDVLQQVSLIADDEQALTQENIVLTSQLNEYTQLLGAIKQQLLDDTTIKIKIKDKQKLIDAQKREYYRWNKLHQLIGSADGKKYRNFAQNLTFEIMVAHANHQLINITDRYLLIPAQDQTLELSVIDNYQAGEIRSAKNLSGGESFIVSLALALGLSKMSSQKVRVDSLFLDEGFGTLDEDALEMALTALTGLQQEGKLIGVISHVVTLKQRINTQIEIIPINNGKSQLKGIGCQQLS